MNTNGHVSLLDLGEVVSEIKVVRPDGRVVLLRMRSLSEQQTFEVKVSIAWPRAKPKKFAKLTDDPSKIVMVPDPNDAEFEKAMDEANRLYVYKMLSHALVMDGLPEAIDERVKMLQSALGAWAYNQLVTHLGKFTGITEAEVEAEAENFPPATSP